MPKISQDAQVTTTASRRRSSRSQVKLTKFDDNEDNGEVRMPEGYNPSDDSEEEYVSQWDFILWK